MHLAVCDDHVADRKQMERLLGRESDRRISTSGVLYVDSYGSERSILSTPMIYDAIFMDMTEDGADAVRIANELRKAGTKIPIIFCCGKVDYRQSKQLPENILFIEKPIQVAALTDMIEQLLVIVNSRTRKLEFRNMTETFYLEEDEILFACPQDNRYMVLQLTNGQQQVAEISFKNFCASLSSCDSYIALANNNVINMGYIQEISLFKVRLTDGTTIRLSLGEAGVLKKMVEEYKKTANKFAPA